MNEESYPKRELGLCRHCGSPVVFVYPMPRQNHLLEALVDPLSEEERTFYEECRRSIVEARR
jgi:hypothetical protein